MAEVNLTVRELRRLWKPQKERLNQEHHQHPTNIRFHRACSWLQRVEEIQDDQVLDHVLLSLWTAFNALYGQWDGERLENQKLSLWLKGLGPPIFAKQSQ